MKTSLCLMILFLPFCALSQTNPLGKSTDSTTLVKPQNCIKGDFCFENTSKKRKVIEVLGADTRFYAPPLFTISIQPGEKGCFYDIPAQVQNIKITTYDVEESGQFLNYTPSSIHTELRQIRVKPCAKEDDIKPLKLSQ